MIDVPQRVQTASKTNSARYLALAHRPTGFFRPIDSCVSETPFQSISRLPRDLFGSSWEPLSGIHIYTPSFHTPTTRQENHKNRHTILPR